MLVDPQTPEALFLLAAAAERSRLLKIASSIIGWSEAEDVVQAALAKAWCALGRFNGDTRGMRSWLCRITQRTAQDARRHRRAGIQYEFLGLRLVTEDDESDLEGRWLTDDQTPESLLLQKEKCQEAHDQAARLLAGCTPDQRRVLWAHAEQECTLAALAERWGEPLSTLKTWHVRGLRRCRAALSGSQV